MKKRYKLLLCIGTVMLLSGCNSDKAEDAISMISDVGVEESTIADIKETVEMTVEKEVKEDEKENLVKEQFDVIGKEINNEELDNNEEGRHTLIYALALNEDKEYNIVSGIYYGTEFDYKLYICEGEDGAYGEPVYTFPDVRENNISIGEFQDIYFIGHRDINADGMVDIYSVARYMIDGKLYYDTRVYMGKGMEFVPDFEYMDEMNSTYYLTTEGALDYPIWEILHGIEY